MKVILNILPFFIFLSGCYQHSIELNDTHVIRIEDARRAIAEEFRSFNNHKIVPSMAKAFISNYLCTTEYANKFEKSTVIEESEYHIVGDWAVDCKKMTFATNFFQGEYHYAVSGKIGINDKGRVLAKIEKIEATHSFSLGKNKMRIP